MGSYDLFIWEHFLIKLNQNQTKVTICMVFFLSPIFYVMAKFTVGFFDEYNCNTVAEEVQIGSVTQYRTKCKSHSH